MMADVQPGSDVGHLQLSDLSGALPAPESCDTASADGATSSHRRFAPPSAPLSGKIGCVQAADDDRTAPASSDAPTHAPLPTSYSFASVSDVTGMSDADEDEWPTAEGAATSGVLMQLLPDVEHVSRMEWLERRSPGSCPTLLQRASKAQPLRPPCRVSNRKRDLLRHIPAERRRLLPPDPRRPATGCWVESDFLGRRWTVFSKAEVARHCRVGDLWLTVHGKVYDATSWVAQHPGGEQAILNRAGGFEDASRDFEFHSSHGRALWRTLYLGELERGPGKPAVDACAIL